MCIFSTLVIWKLHFKVQTSIEVQNFGLLLFVSLHSSSFSFKLLSMASYGGELLLDSSSPWSGVSNHISSFCIPLLWSSRSKGLHWWRRSKAYKLHMELHQKGHGRSQILQPHHLSLLTKTKNDKKEENNYNLII